MNEQTYALTPAIRARLMGALLVLVGLLLVAVTFVVAVARLDPTLMLVLVAAVPVVVFGAAALLSRRLYVVRLDDVGYSVRMVRGVGAAKARWADVLDLTAVTLDETRCVVMRLRDGRTTTIPVDVIQGDSEEFVRELGRRLSRQ